MHHKNMSHRSGQWFIFREKGQPWKESWGGLVKQDGDVNHFRKVIKWKEYMNYMKKRNKMIYIMSKKSAPHKDLCNINKIRSKVNMR